MELLDGGEDGAGLGGALLSVPEFGEGGKPEDHDRPRIRPVAANRKQNRC